jgi:ribosome-binding protein aMBF1 (putative translation factor)
MYDGSQTKRGAREGRSAVVACRVCGKTREGSSPVGRTECCDGCGADLHVCRNCQFFDPAAYNECREPRAERVVEKDRANFCDWFRGTTGPPEKGRSDQDAVRKKLETLFRKP